MPGTPWIAMYPSDYLADTAHLGLTEHGVYWRLLLHYYQHHSPLPADTDKLCRIVLATSPEERRTVEYILCEFFVLAALDDGTQVWRNLRADREIADAKVRQAVNLARAQAGAAARWKANEKMLEASVKHSPSNAQAMLSTSTSTSTSRSREKHTCAIAEKSGMAPDGSGKQKSTYPPEFEATWNAYPKRLGGNSKADAFKAWRARRKAGVPAEELHTGVVRYGRFLQASGKAGSEYVKQAATFFGPAEHWREPWTVNLALAGQVGTAAAGDW